MFHIKSSNFFCIFYHLEPSLKIAEREIRLPSNSSLDNIEGIDKLQDTLAPLASSETFSDVVSVSHDEEPKILLTINNGIPHRFDQIDNATKTHDNFSSLELLFDFSNVNLTNETQVDDTQTPENNGQMRYSGISRLNRRSKVKFALYLQISLF